MSLSRRQFLTGAGLTLAATAAGCKAGEVAVGPEESRVREGFLGLLGPGNRLSLRAPSQRSEILVAAARPLREPIAQRGPFVMNTEQELRQAFADYRAGRLGRD